MKAMDYQVGGCLKSEAEIYTKRKADDELYESIKEGRELCYILAPRQMGKSSLRARTTASLRREGFVCVLIDLCNIGEHGVTAEQWYQGFLSELVDELKKNKIDLDVDAKEWWENNNSPTLNLKLSKFFQNIVLSKVENPIVIFIDEVDSILRLNFPLDDFWAWMKSFYDQRNNHPEYRNVVFVLLGVATPNELCKDPARSPLNIGTAIDLTGFKLEEMDKLVAGIGREITNRELLIKQIHGQTGGQPFLTQKLCRLLQRSQITDLNDWNAIENLIHQRIMINWEEQDNPEHLRTIRNRITNSSNRIQLLFLCQKIYQNEHKEIDFLAQDPIYQELRLSGLVVKQGGKLRILNKIYTDIFNLSWIQAELRKLGIMHNRYRMIKEIGRGGFGITYLVEDFNLLKSPTKKVIKELSPSQNIEVDIDKCKEYFEREAKILNDLRSNLIPIFYECFEEDGKFFQVHEFIEGTTLHDELEQNQGPIPEDETIKILTEILEILHYIHSIKPDQVIHRDIKPSNIIRRQKDRKLVLIDFGIAVEIADEVQKTSPYTIVGTPGYTSPEQAEGRPCSQSDIYSLGIVGIQSLSGQGPQIPPKSVSNPYWVALNNSTASPELKNILRKMTDLEIENRYQSSREVLDDLAKLKQQGIIAKPKTRTRINLPSLRLSNTNLIGFFSLAMIMIMIAWIKPNFPMLFVHFPSTHSPTPTISPAIAPSIDLSKVKSISISIGGNEGIPDRKDNKLNDNYIKLKRNAMRSFNSGRYEDAYKQFYQMRQSIKPNDEKIAKVARQDPQILIYMNNAKVKYLQQRDWYTYKKITPIYTIAAVFPINTERGEQALFGIAHLQHNVVNPKDSTIDRFKFDKDSQEALIKIPPSVYLQVAIVDDKNDPDKVESISQELTTITTSDADGTPQKIIGVVGHYTSEVTCRALPMYSKAKLPIISPLSTVTEFRRKCGDEQGMVFHRTASSSRFEAGALANEVNKYKKPNPKIIIFYKEGTEKDFSQDLFNNFNNALTPSLKKNKPIDLGKKFSLQDLKKDIEEADIIVDLPDGKNAGGSTQNDLPFAQSVDILTVLSNATKETNRKYLVLTSNTLLTTLETKAKKNESVMRNLHNQLIIATDWSEDHTTANTEFIKEYQNLWGGSLNRTTALSYEAAQVFSELINKGKKNREDIINELNAPTIPVPSYVFQNKNIAFYNEKDSDKKNYFPGDRKEIAERILVTPDAEGTKFVRYPAPDVIPK